MVHNRRAFDDARVVHENVHAPGVLDDFGDEVGGALLGELAEILGVGVELRAQRFRLGAGLGLVADVHADGMRALAGERERNGLADAPARSGDDGNFAGKTFCFHDLSFCLVRRGEFHEPQKNFCQGVAELRPPENHLKSAGFTPSMSSNTWFSPAMPQMNL